MKRIPLSRRCSFKTARLAVTSWKKEISNDATELSKWIPEILTPAVTKTLPPDWQGLDSPDAVQSWIRKQDEEGDVFLVSSGEERIGILILTEQNETIRLGYVISENYWGKGLGSELIRGLVEWCTKDGTIHALVGGVDENNPASIKILEKNGFSPDTSEESPPHTVFMRKNFLQS